MQRRFTLLVLALFLGCRAPAPGPAPTPRGPGLFDHHVHLLSPTLVRDWKSLGVPFSRPDEVYLTADGLFAARDEDPSERLEGALLVPMAHFYGNAEFREALGIDLDAEHARVRAENDHVAAEAARRPDRTRALVSVDLLRPYALEEIARGIHEHHVAGVKVHLASAGFRFDDAAHVAALERVAARVERAGLLLLLHVDPQYRGLQTTDVRRLLDEAFRSHPDLRLLIAHCGGSGGIGPWPQSVLRTIGEWLADERAAGRPRPDVHVDLSAVPMIRESEGVPPSTDEEVATLAPLVRAVGVERFVFGSDAPVFDPREHARFLRERCGFTADELATIFRATVE